MMKVCHLTQGAFEVPFVPDQTVSDYLAQFGGVGGGNTVSFNGSPVDGSTNLTKPGTLIVAPKIRNG
jgi:sulfur carrier protein ThiS